MPDDAYVRTLFLARLAHELRGPTGVIHGALRELESELGPDAERFRSLLSMADRGVRQVLRTAMLLEETAQFEQGKVEFTRLPCDVIGVVRQAALEAEAPRMIAVEIEVPSAPCLVSIDARWLAVALDEIFSNALRHASTRVIVRVAVSDLVVRIECTDDNRSPRAFAPVRFREPSERRGHGLGLAIARDVITAHQGTLEITMGDCEAIVAVQLPRQVATRQDLGDTGVVDATRRITSRK